jgi:hypothetical protein
MKNVVFDPRTYAFITGTRAALAVGIGLLGSGKVVAKRRRAIGAGLFAIGVVTTIPAAISVMQELRRSSRVESYVDRDTRLIGATRFPRKGDDVV